MDIVYFYLISAIVLIAPHFDKELAKKCSVMCTFTAIIFYILEVMK